jgi:cation diffusion facilitator family transporter
VALVAGKGYEAADDVAALFASAVIAFNGIRLLRSAWQEVLDVAPPKELVDEIRAISHAVEGVAAIDKCRVRRSGLGVFVDLHVVVDGNMPVREGHDIAHRVKDVLLESDHGILDVVVHVEPVFTAPSDTDGEPTPPGEDRDPR